MCNDVELGPTEKIKTFLWEEGQLKISAYCPLQCETFHCAFNLLMISRNTWESFLAACAIAIL